MKSTIIIVNTPTITGSTKFLNSIYVYLRLRLQLNYGNCENNWNVNSLNSVVAYHTLKVNRKVSGQKGIAKIVCAHLM